MIYYGDDTVHPAWLSGEPYTNADCPLAGGVFDRLYRACGGLNWGLSRYSE